MSKNIYFGGSIHTMEEGPQPEAILVENGRIQALGGKAEIFLERDAATSLVDLEGRALLPAFIDAHSHITAVATTLDSLSLAGAKSCEDIAGRVAAYREERRLPPGKWITAFGYDQNELDEKRHPDKTVLDAAAPDNPVVVTHASGHMGVLNSAGLKSLGVNADTPDPDGGRIGRVKGGREPDGYLEETAFTALTAKIPRPTLEERTALLEEAQKIYFSHGVTTVQDGITGPAEWEVLEAIAESGKLLADVVCYIDLANHKDLAKSNPAYLRQYHNHLKIGGYKIFLDCSPQGRTAWMTAPYRPAEPADDPAYTGYPVHTEEAVAGFLDTALADGMQILTHCNGDAAAAQFIAAYDTARGKHPSAPEIRPVMIHAQLLRPDQMPAMKRLGMIPSFFVAHTWFWGDAHLKNFGWQRAEKISPAGSALLQGLPFTFHQDSPVVPPDMLFTLWCAARRLTKAGAHLDLAEALSVPEALRAVTANAAYQYFEENQKGRLRPGMRADLVVLDKDPLSVPVDEVKDISVLQTIKDGRLVYEK